MKYSNYIGALTGIILILACFLPWVYIPSLQSDLTGLNTGKTSFGKPGFLNIIFCIPAIILFIIPAVWAKRVNIFLVAMNMAWAVRNFILFSLCEAGECPDKKVGLYLNLICSVIIMIASLFPGTSGKRNNV